MKKKILIIGNSAAEYALAKELSQENEIYITSVNDTLKEFATCLDIRETNSAELLEYVMENGIDITIPISVEALKSDIVELFNKNNQKIFAPNQRASKLIYDKAFTKKMLYKLRIPTPKFGIFEKQNMVLDYIKNLSAPFIIKSEDENSAVIFTSYQNAKPYVDMNFIDKNKRLIIEDYIYGTSFSFYVLTDGYKALPIGSSLTYKYSLEGDGGQLTQGLGACSPNYNLSLEHEYFLMDNVVDPIIDYLQIEGCPYVGILGINGILTEDGKIFVIGVQNFMQNCDAQAVLSSLDENLYELFYACVIGVFSDEYEYIKTKNTYASTLVLMCKNKNNNENVINGLENLDENTKLVFYPSVVKNKYLEYEANTGEVLSLTTVGSTVSSAINKLYDEAKELDFRGLFYRKDVCKPKL